MTEGTQGQCEKALERANERLKKEGEVYPVYINGSDRAAYMKDLDRYIALQSQYYIEALRTPSGVRPIVLDNTIKQEKYTPKWMGRKYEDE